MRSNTVSTSTGSTREARLLLHLAHEGLFERLAELHRPAGHHPAAQSGALPRRISSTCPSADHDAAHAHDRGASGLTGLGLRLVDRRAAGAGRRRRRRSRDAHATRPGQRVEAGRGEQRRLRLARHDQEEERDAEHADVAAPAPQVHALEGAIAEGAHHQEGRARPRAPRSRLACQRSRARLRQHEHDRRELRRRPPGWAAPRSSGCPPRAAAR